MSSNNHAEIIRRWITLGLGLGEWSLIDTSFAATYHFVARTGSMHGREALRQALTGLRAAFPDLVVTIDELVEGAGTVIVRTTYGGTHHGAFMGVPATGRRVSWAGITVYRFRGDTVAEEWALWDTLGLAEQLGLHLQPAAS